MKYLILGAGPAGLAFSNWILQKGEKDFLVIEKENEVGGLCRSTIVDGFPFDIGGGHFLDTRRPKVNEFLFSFMPEEEWDVYDRKTSLVLGSHIIGQPIEAFIWQLPIDEQIEYLMSIAAAGCNTGVPMPKKFVSWIYWKLGKRIAEDYMLPYNSKIFGSNLDVLGTYWLEKLPNVSFEDTLRSCLLHKKYGSDPGHTRFYYPKKYGYGELWLRMGKALGDRLVLRAEIEKLDMQSRTVWTKDGDSYTAERMITTIPWTEFTEITGIPDEQKNDIATLKHSSIQTEYHSDMLDTDSHWVYYPNPELPYHRILVRHNFCPGSKGYWTETNAERLDIPYQPPVQQKAMRIIGHMEKGYQYFNKYAYPLNTRKKPKVISRILQYAEKYKVYGLGRWGEWEHYNSDVTVERAIALAEHLFI